MRKLNSTRLRISRGISPEGDNRVCGLVCIPKGYTHTFTINQYYLQLSPTCNPIIKPTSIIYVIYNPSKGPTCHPYFSHCITVTFSEYFVYFNGNKSQTMIVKGLTMGLFHEDGFISYSWWRKEAEKF